jgi:hypothetical protein
MELQSAVENVGGPSGAAAAGGGAGAAWAEIRAEPAMRMTWGRRWRYGDRPRRAGRPERKRSWAAGVVSREWGLGTGTGPIAAPASGERASG